MLAKTTKSPEGTAKSSREKTASDPARTPAYKSQQLTPRGPGRAAANQIELSQERKPDSVAGPTLSRAEPHGLSCDFSKIPIFPPDRRSQPSAWDPRGRDSYPDLLFPQLSNPSQEVPHRAAMESAFGEDFSTVRASTGRSAALDGFGADAAAGEETVVFASTRPSKHLVAHELAT